MEKVSPWCGQPSDRGQLKSRTDVLLTGEEAMACAAAAAAGDDMNTSDSESQADSTELHATNFADIADDDDIDENLFDGDDLDIVEQQLDSLDVVD